VAPAICPWDPGNGLPATAEHPAGAGHKGVQISVVLDQLIAGACNSGALKSEYTPTPPSPPASSISTNHTHWTSAIVFPWDAIYTPRIRGLEKSVNLPQTAPFCREGLMYRTMYTGIHRGYAEDISPTFAQAWRFYLSTHHHTPSFYLCHSTHMYVSSTNRQ
jgi:hypothetical protein